MAENNGGAAGAAGSGEGGVKTFTQEEVNALIGKRVNEVTSKYADYEALKAKASKYDEEIEPSKSELQKATEAIKELKSQLNGFTKAESIRKIREKIAEETKVPASLLTAEDEEKCREQAAAILEFAKPKEYPGAKRNTKKETIKSEADESMREFVQQMFGKGE